MDYLQILENIYQSILPYAKEGKQADYIPELAKVNPDQFGMCIHTIYGEIASIEQADTKFSIQSISKVFALAMCLSIKGMICGRGLVKNLQALHLIRLFNLKWKRVCLEIRLLTQGQL